MLYAFYSAYFTTNVSLPSVQVQIPQYVRDYLILVLGEISVLVIASVYNILRRKNENKELVDALKMQTLVMGQLLEELKAERDARSK